jgi:hypothetical protein
VTMTLQMMTAEGHLPRETVASLKEARQIVHALLVVGCHVTTAELVDQEGEVIAYYEQSSWREWPRPTASDERNDEVNELKAEVERLRADPRLAFTGQDYCDLRNALANLDGIIDTSDLDEKLRQAFIANRAEEVRDE